MFHAAGTPEAGGWTTREVKRILRGLAGLNFVYVVHPFLNGHQSNQSHKLPFISGADVVEVAPAYDHGECIHTCVKLRILRKLLSNWKCS